MMEAQTQRSRRKAERPEQILAAAQRVLLERGFQGLTIDEVASTAKIAKGTVYLYFKNILDLRANLLKYSLMDLRQRMSGCSTNGNGSVRLRRMLALYVRQILERHRALALDELLLQEQSSGALSRAASMVCEAAVLDLIEMVGSVIRQGQADRSIREDLKARETAVILLASLRSLGVSQIKLRKLCPDGALGGASSEAASSVGVDLLCRGLETKRKSAGKFNIAKKSSRARLTT
ncbi:MAG TPA: TetR/AcrR family transcriptional regulator [Polyangiaceae bacterium]|nr:TetR/AcrR family transcriptional regulator [Polyangiaceae bacterium]